MKKVGMYGGKFWPPHKGHLHCIEAASNQVDVLYVVMNSSENRDYIAEIEVKNPNLYMCLEPEYRMNFLGTAIRDLENVKLIEVKDNFYDCNYDWEAVGKDIIAAIPETITHVFGSEPEYESIFKKIYKDAEYVLIDPDRVHVNISATTIRDYGDEIWKYPYIFEMLLPEMQKIMMKRICITGTESTGKSTLTKKLASYFNGIYVEEVGREYADKCSNFMVPNQFDEIAMVHYQKIMNPDKIAPIMFIDTDALVTQYYLGEYLNMESSLIKTIYSFQRGFIDNYFYIEPTNKWVDDGLRFLNENRKLQNSKLLYMYNEEMIKIDLFLNGTYQENYEKAIKFIQEV